MEAIFFQIHLNNEWFQKAMYNYPATLTNMIMRPIK